MYCLVCDDPWLPGHRVTVSRKGRLYELGVCRRCAADGYRLSELSGDLRIFTPDRKGYEVDPTGTKESTRTARVKRLRREEHLALPGTEELFAPPETKRKRLRAESPKDGERKERRHG